MGTYNAGEKTKRNILSKSKKLFYNNGIKNTTYSQISKSAKVNIGTIVYHFKSINSIADIIYQQILRERHLAFTKQVKALKLQNMDLVTLSLAEYRVHTECYLQYPRYQHFVSEVLTDSLVWSNDQLNNSTKHICEKYNINLPEEDYLLHKFLFLPFSSLVSNAINSNMLTLSSKQICEYHTKIRLLALGVPNEEIIKLLNEVDSISTKITLHVDENFKFS